MAASQVEPDLSTSELIEVRRSNVHGLGVFAARQIPKGTRIIEYVGDRVSHDEADRRYEEKDENDSHTFLFIIDNKTVIDAGVDGNDARFFNHSCDPNCESTVEKRRVYIEAVRDIEAGAELTYDYQIQREDDDPDNIDAVFACRCGFAQCRGTMLWPTERKPKRKKAKKKAQRKGKGKGQQKGKGKTRPGTRSGTNTQLRTRSKSRPAARTAAHTHLKSKAKSKTQSTARRQAKTDERKTRRGAPARKKTKRSGRRR